MLRKYFVRLKTQIRVQEGPLGRYVGDYVTLLHNQGYSQQSISQRARLVAGWSRWIQKRAIRPESLDAACIRRYLLYRRKHRRPGCMDRPALRRFLAWLCAKGIARPPVVPLWQKRYQKEAEAFRQYLRKERGLCADTAIGYLPFVRRFLKERFGHGPICLSKLCAKDIIGHVRRQAGRLSPGHKPKLMTSLRAFLRYLCHRGDISTDLAACVPAVANWKLSTLPKFIEASEVEKVLRAVDLSAPSGRRNYAILLLLARLGLRGGEVAGLKLDECHWDIGEITVRAKGGRMDRLPLPHDVGQAMTAYLKKDRPTCQSRNVFVRLIPPYKEFSHSGPVSHLVRRALVKAGVASPRTGAHLLRHSLATAMLRHGASLPEIGQVLRHRSVDTTALYAKVDLISLRGLARPWPGGEK